MDENNKQMRRFIDSTYARWQDIPIMPADHPLRPKKISDIPISSLTEYNASFEMGWEDEPPEYNGGALVGAIRTKAGSADIMAVRPNELEVRLWAITTNNENLGVIVLEGFPDKKYSMIKRIQVNKQYQNKGIASEMMAFLIEVIGFEPINDIERSLDGIKLWKKLATVFVEKIVYLPTEEVFNKEDAGKKETSDGRVVILPEKDNGEKLYTDDPIKGQRFFYTLQTNGLLKEDTTYTRWYDIDEHIQPIVPPRYHHFKDGAP